MASDLRSGVREFEQNAQSGSSSSEGSGEDIEGVEYAPRSADDSDSGRSLEDFVSDGDSASSHSQSFYRAINNEKSQSPLHLPRGLASVVNKASGHVPTPPFARGSSPRKGTCLPLPEAFPRCRLPAGPQSRASKRASVETSVGEPDLSSPVRKRGRLGRERRRAILSQESAEEQHLPQLLSFEAEKSPRSGLGCNQEKGGDEDQQAQVMLPSRTLDSGLSDADLEDRLRVAGRCEEAHNKAVALPSTLYACPKPTVSAVASTNGGEVLRQVAVDPVHSACDTLRATSCADNHRTTNLPVVEDALTDNASSQPTECFAALSEECEAPAKVNSAASMNLADAAPCAAQVGATPCLDPILAAAHHFHSLGVVTVTLDLDEECNRAGEVKKSAKRLGAWSQANYGNCLSEEFAKPGRNSIAIVTEASDIFAVDVDVKDGGFKALERMLEEHGGFVDDTPRVTTGNGGLHILFSLSKSEKAGLRNSRNRARIWYKGERVGIDIRGRGGMLYTAPSRYQGLDGELRRYEWDHEIHPNRSNLRAIPDWLIAILNVDQPGTANGARSRTRLPAPVPCRSTRSPEDLFFGAREEDQSPPPPTVFSASRNAWQPPGTRTPASIS
ncbi:hypothetical protein KFL_004770030 [Klebsormidium nitens]|uniref:DNA primase/polymerase bifunctional N-terminal domain-containing protein n=1 Tax=Klebsormidium nitens TaxID=105231 RepID=A0A1Y1IDF3_KLENI|nr:hypothetical protein KFL_004770030 [Klebsormidium nitens]|eukprot:GAQ88995.1 hypothetical protein KFL_004770030 [Klebsormidium nitens]